MTRPRCKFKVGPCPKFEKFGPEGVCDKKSEVVEILPEEVEALRLKHIRGLHQEDAAEKMGVSQSTFQRVLESAHKKVSEALIHGEVIHIVENKNKQ